MLEPVLFGLNYGAACAAQPGPMQAFFLSRVAQVGWRRTLPACLAPILGDGPIAALVLLALRQVPSGMERALRVAGGLLLLYMAFLAFRSLRRDDLGAQADSERTPHSLLQALAVNIMNPAPYISWATVLGPDVMRQWTRQPAGAIGLVAAFYAVLTVGNAFLIVAMGLLHGLGPRFVRGMILVSALLLAALGVWRVAGSAMG